MGTKDLIDALGQGIVAWVALIRQKGFDLELWAT